MNPRASLVVFACPISIDYDVDLVLFEPHPGRRGASMQRSLRYPVRKSNVEFASVDCDFVIVLYSNHTQEDEEFEDKDYAGTEILSGELICFEGLMLYEDTAQVSINVISRAPFSLASM
ncbi:uncharacterized protein ARMOST_02870 [Armillaria ostoyae]|uniref:Uncharacterized protein n=1 Tax=Armillaria ostoyae TaxID=47428 RepID=A0A284QSU3_ARMOS|nr:uncharacterized protein ARMOST_02870 [Armillaria ostoyae]